jgi:signal transduction histidine kinase
LKQELETIAPLQAATAGMIQKLLKQTTIEARNLARGVFPTQIETDGLASAIRDFVSQKNALGDGIISFVSCGDIRVEDTQIAMHLYRITQESVNNAIRHSAAKSILVVLSQEGPCLELTISDDGRGFETVDNTVRGIGLRTMCYRAQLIGAAIAITNRPGPGAMVRCTIRIPAGTVVSHASPR